MMARITDLPPELITMIVGDFDHSPRDILPYTLLDRRFHDISDPILYRRLDQTYRDCLLYWAISKNQPGTLEKLLETGANPQAPAVLTFYKFARLGDGSYFRTVARFMQGFSGHMYVWGDLPLYHAVFMQNCKTIDILLGAGADINGPSTEAAPLSLAVAWEAQGIVQHLLLRGADANKSVPLPEGPLWKTPREWATALHMTWEHAW